MVRGALPLRQHRAGGGGAACTAWRADRHGRGDLLEGGLCPGAGGAGRGHHQSGHLQLRWHRRDARHRRNGAAARRGGGAAQLQLDPRRGGRDGAAFSDDPELLDRRVLHQPEAGLRRDRSAAAGGEGQFCRAADDTGARHRSRRGAAAKAAVSRYGLAHRQDPAELHRGVSAQELRERGDADRVSAAVARARPVHRPTIRSRSTTPCRHEEARPRAGRQLRRPRAKVPQ